jgi:hypothetical protein
MYVFSKSNSSQSLNRDGRKRLGRRSAFKTDEDPAVPSLRAGLNAGLFWAILGNALQD